jgi:molybdenum cofactor cytidylyltransferase
MTRVTGIVLGAGASSRLGRPKQTLPLGDTTLLGWVMRDVEASELDEVVLVVGGAAERALEGLRLRRARVAHNDAYGSGCASSLLAGLDAAGECDAVMLVLGDMPGVDPALIDGVRAAWQEEGSWAAVTQYEDGLGHPLVFSAAAFPDLRALHGDKAVWKIVDREPERVRRLPVQRTVPRDVDTEEDYEAVRRSLEADELRTSGGRRGA